MLIAVRTKKPIANKVLLRSRIALREIINAVNNMKSFGAIENWANKVVSIRIINETQPTYFSTKKNLTSFHVLLKRTMANMEINACDTQTLYPTIFHKDAVAKGNNGGPTVP